MIHDSRCFFFVFNVFGSFRDSRSEECEIGFEATTEAKWCRWFFLCFHVIGVILVNNLVTAFVIGTSSITGQAISAPNLSHSIDVVLLF